MKSKTPKVNLTDPETIDINRTGAITKEQSKALDSFYRDQWKSRQRLSTLGFIFVGIIWFAIILAEGNVNQRVPIWLAAIGFLLLAGALIINNLLEKKRLAVPENTYRAWNKKIQSTTAISLSGHIINGTLVFFPEDTGKQIALALPEKAVFNKENTAYKLYHVDGHLLSLEPLVDDELFIKTYNAWLRQEYRFTEDSLKTNADHRLMRNQSIRALIQEFMLVLSVLLISILGISFCMLVFAGVFFAVLVVIFFILLSWMAYGSIKDGFRLKAYNGLVTWRTRRFFGNRSWHLVLKEAKRELLVYPHQVRGFVNGIYHVYYLQGSILGIQFLSHQKTKQRRVKPAGGTRRAK